MICKTHENEAECAIPIRVSAPLFACLFSCTTLAAIAPHSDAIPARGRRAARRLMGPSNWSLMLPFISLVSTRLGLFVLLVPPAAAD